jgi:periplasmic protein TonB
MIISPKAALRTAVMTPGNRLRLTLFLAAAIHTIVIFGVSFDADSKKPISSPSLDIVLVSSASERAPDKVDYIAHANSQASGSAIAKLLPTSPALGPALATTAGRMPSGARAAPVVQQQNVEHVLLNQQHADMQVSNDLYQSQETLKIGHSRAQINLELARLTSELAKDAQHYAQRPRINYLETLSAKSALEAPYVKAWVDKVERIGNLNYPDDARRSNLSGTLILHVLLASDGSIIKAFIGSPSGQQVLDNAAMHIVKLAAPFQPFPPGMREKYDQLMITRTWIFESKGALATQ